MISFVLMSVLLLVGALMHWLQIRHLKKNFLSPGQFRLVSLIGMLAFFGMAFVALKMLFT